MTKIDKLIQKLHKNPSDLTWNELVKVLGYYGFSEVKTKGKTAGSRRKFINDTKEVISLHKPHPKPVVKEYVIKQIIEKLKIKDE